MKKVYIYSLVLIAGIVSLIAWDLYKENYRKDYHYFQREWTYESSEPNDIAFLVDKKTYNITYFLVLGHTQDHRLCIRYGNNPNLIDPENLGKRRYIKEGVEIHASEYWVSEIFDNKKAWSQDLSIISQSKIMEDIEKNKVYYYKRLMGIDYLPDNLIIVSVRVVTILGLYIIIFSVMSTHRYLKKLYQKIAMVFIFCVLICVSFLLASFFMRNTYSLVFQVALFKNLVSFLSLWFLMLWVNKQLSYTNFGKKELIKFVFIAIFGLIVEYFGDQIAMYIYFNFTEGSQYKRYSMFANGMAFYPLWIYFAVANFMSNLTIYLLDLRKKEKLFKQQKSEGNISSSTLASIQSRINPHFLYNALNSIASLARTEPRKTEEMALQLAKFYDQCSSIKSKSLISLSEELNIVKSYLKIEKIRFGDRLHVWLPDDSEIPMVMIPSFLLQPIVENAIKYGYSSDDNVIHIRITAEINDTLTKLRIYDSGPPFSENMHSGYGINSISKKLKVLYPDRYTMSFVNEPEKCVEIIIYHHIQDTR
jgi:sensor histidine kinase YesM